MSAHRSWLGINPAMCLKDSDAPPCGMSGRTRLRNAAVCTWHITQ